MQAAGGLLPNSPLCAAVALLALCFDCAVVTCEGQRWASAKCSNQVSGAIKDGSHSSSCFLGTLHQVSYGACSVALAVQSSQFLRNSS